MKDIHRKVLQMREQEKTYVEIGQETGLAKSTVSYVLDRYFPKDRNAQISAKHYRASVKTEGWKRSHAAARKAADLKYQKEREDLRDEYLRVMHSYPDQSFIYFVSGLYEGEGRHGQNTTVDFCNSNPDIIKPFLRFLREVLVFGEERFALRLALHTSLPKDECVKYWEEVCSHAIDFVDQYDTRAQKKVYKHNKAKKFYGTLTVRVKRPNGLKAALKKYTY